MRKRGGGGSIVRTRSVGLGWDSCLVDGHKKNKSIEVFFLPCCCPTLNCISDGFKIQVPVTRSSYEYLPRVDRQEVEGRWRKSRRKGGKEVWPGSQGKARKLTTFFSSLVKTRKITLRGVNNCWEHCWAWLCVLTWHFLVSPFVCERRKERKGRKKKIFSHGIFRRG